MKVVKLLFISTLSSFFALGQPVTCPKTDTEIKTLPVLWQQDASEYRALCYQAFNIAMVRINQIPKADFQKYKLAIITDLDETILDNSPSTARAIKRGTEFNTDSINNWVKLSAATEVPGAVEFLQAAKKKGISIFYISNRDTSQIQATLVNLKKLKLPDTDASHMLFFSNTSSKEERRIKVEKKYKVVLLLGDNLNDFAKAFEDKTIATRFNETDKAKALWGKKFIVLPNSDYGEWERILYSRGGLSVQQKATERLQLLKGY